MAVDYMLDKDRRENSMGLAISLNVLLEFGREQSFDYTFEVRYLKGRLVHASDESIAWHHMRTSPSDIYTDAFSLCLVLTSSACDVQEFTAMAKEAGFARTALIPLVPGARSTVPISSAAVAYKA